VHRISLLEIPETIVLTEPPGSRHRKGFSPSGNALAEEAARHIDIPHSLQTLRIAACQREADKCRKKANNDLHTQRKHREDEGQPLLCAKCRRLNVDERRDKNSDNEQNDTSDKEKFDHPVHLSGV
jgi:N-formylglutamate amidohydrolase